MNTLYPNLKFTLERPTDGKLPFLDTEVKQISNQLHTKVYRKATGTGLNKFIEQNEKNCSKMFRFKDLGTQKDLSVIELYTRKSYIAIH